jgi:hypothetical protein
MSAPLPACKSLRGLFLCFLLTATVFGCRRAQPPPPPPSSRSSPLAILSDVG